MSPARTPPLSAWAGTPDAAFDVWLDRGLAGMFGLVAEEPIPAELLAAIERSRRKS